SKSLKECCTYILGEARKRGNAVAISDEEVYGMAVHYYDEDNIKVAKMPANVKVSSSSVSKPVELTEEDKDKAREAAIQRLAEEQHALLRKKSTKAKKVDSEVQQMSLF
ncbi:MAG: Cas9 inhibitor AcrIIA9 family protein, partial [Bacteroides sp.]